MTHPTQLSLTAHYGPDKPDALRALIRESQEAVAERLGDRFSPYDMAQAHATVISFERAQSLPGYVNRFFHELRDEQREMDLDGALAYLREQAPLPFRVQLGGWSRKTTPFTSQGRPPYERSFSIRGDKMVVIGWPVADDGYPATLNNIRHACAEYGLLHKYFAREQAVDNDFYLRLGLLDAPLDDDERAATETALRSFLGQREPLLLEVALTDLMMVAYVDEPLTYASSQHWPLDDPQLTGDFLRGLYG